MMRAVSLAFVLALGTSLAFAAEEKEEEHTLSDAQAAKVKAALAEIGCGEWEHAKHEEEGDVYEIDDAACKMGTMDIKLDKDFKVLLISRY
jgi:hypothetical protein